MPAAADALDGLAVSLRGQLVRPDDAAYDEARAVWNAAIDRRPLAIVRCADAADIERAVEFARAHDLVVAVRGGGHSFAGKSTCDGGVVVDCSPMRGVEVDPRRRRARVEAGCTLADLDRATQAFGLATTMGTAPPTGVAGLTLGGGLGWLMGRHGLACDNLVAAEIVTADGRRRRADGDLLWGLRGGGGNFGVVTTFEFQLHPVGTVYGGSVSYPLGEVRDVLRRYRDLTANAPDELTAFVGLLPLATGPAFAVAACWCGDPARGETVLAPLRSFGTPIESTLRAMPYEEMQALLSPPPLRLATYARSNLLRALTDDAIDALVAAAETAPPAFGLFFLEHLHGAASRVGPDEAAFAHRGPAYNLAVMASWMEPADADASASWVRDFFDRIAPFFGAGVYSNYLMGDEAAGRVRAAYGAAYPRLLAVKRAYDPTNLFRLNQNIDPSSA